MWLSCLLSASNKLYLFAIYLCVDPVDESVRLESIRLMADLGTPGSRVAVPPGRPTSNRGKDHAPRAKASSATTFSSKWRYIKDIGLGDLRDLLFKLNKDEACLPLIKTHSKEELLFVFEYVTGLDPSESLDTRCRDLTEDTLFLISPT